MPFCLNLHAVSRCLAAGAFAWTLPTVATAAGLVGQSVIVPHVRSVVRADARGRLVRTVITAPQLVLAADAALPEIVETAAKKYEVDPLLVHSVIQVESGYNAYAVSPKGAQGIMQLMPATARRFGVANSFDPRENIEGGVRYLKYLQSLFPEDSRLAIAAYNAGEGAVWKYNNQIPPYRETENYVYKVGQRYVQARRHADQNKKPAKTLPPAVSAYSPVQYFVDANGLLHMQTGTP